MFSLPAGAILHDPADSHVHPSSRLLLLGHQFRPGLLLDVFSGERRMRITSGGRERRIRIVLVHLLVDHGDDCVRCRTHLHSHPQHPGDPGNQKTGVQRGSADTSAQGRQRSHFRRKFDRKFETFGDDGHAPGRFFVSHRDDASGHHTIRPLSDVPRRKCGVEGRSQESRPHLAEALHVQRNPDRDRRTRAFALRLQLLYLPPDRENIPSTTSIDVDEGVLPRSTLQRCTARLVPRGRSCRTPGGAARPGHEPPITLNSPGNKTSSCPTLHANREISDCRQFRDFGVIISTVGTIEATAGAIEAVVGAIEAIVRAIEAEAGTIEVAAGLFKVDPFIP